MIGRCLAGISCPLYVTCSKPEVKTDAVNLPSIFEIFEAHHPGGLDFFLLL